MYPKSSEITPKLHRAGFIQKTFFGLKLVSFFPPSILKQKALTERKDARELFLSLNFWFRYQFNPHSYSNSLLSSTFDLLFLKQRGK